MAENDSAKTEDQKPEIVDSNQGSPMLGLKVVMIGATGAVGKCLLGEFLASKNFAEVVVLGRRNATIPESYGIDQKAEEESGRLKQHTVDFSNLTKETVGEFFVDKHALFCSIGTTRKSAGSEENYRRIENYAVTLAEIAKANGVQLMSHISGDGASKNSWFYDARIKGEAEEALKKFEFPRTSIFRPGWLDRGDQARAVEKFFGVFVKSMPVATVAKAMRVDAENYFTGEQSSEKGAEGGQDSPYFNADINHLAGIGKKECKKK